MLLKTLSLSGFKSFADRTRIEFDSGVNVIVGPNGTGKSNLVDALAWVMGTQATRLLRTEKMEDVIFAGTATRPAMNRAEIVLTFDNADGFLPIDVAEVTMTRRLYRDGTSEYLLNGATCRLLDLHELLSDGGVGRSQHALVGQGQIGDILNARPDEHRAVIEEAAGITKHRSRRDRSVRRLEQTELDMERLDDILDQQRRRLRPLKRQANAAEQYESVRDQVRGLRLWIGGSALRSLSERRDAATAEHRTLDGQAGANEKELTTLQHQLEGLRADATEVARILQRDTAAAARLETVGERLQRIAMVARERRYSIESRRRGAVERRDDLSSELASHHDAIDEMITDEASSAASAAQATVTLQVLEEEANALAEQVALPAEGLVASLRGDLRALEIAADRDATERRQLDQRQQVVGEHVAAKTTEAQTLIVEIQEADAAAGPAQDAYTCSVEETAKARAAFGEVDSGFHAAGLEVAGATARVEAIAAALDGLGNEDAGVLAEQSSEIRGAAVAMLDIPQDMAAAVDAALGVLSRGFVAVDADAAVAMIHRLKQNTLGGISIVAPGDTPDVTFTRRAAAEAGVDVLVDRLGGGADVALAAQLLGDVVICEGWTAAQAIVAGHPRLRAVTPEGDLITANAVHVAVPDGAGPAALEAAHAALEVAQRDLAGATSRRTTLERELAGSCDIEEAARDTLELLEARVAGHTEALAFNERARNEADSELARLGARAGALGQAVAARNERIAELRLRVDELAGEERRRQDAWEALHRRKDEVFARRDLARTAQSDATAALAALRERRKLTEARIERINQDLAGLDGRPVKQTEFDILSETGAVAQAAVDMVRRHIETLRERQRELRSRASAADAKLVTARRRRDELDLATRAARDRIATLSIELAEVRVRLEAVAEGLRRDADATEDEALAAQQPEITDGEDVADLLSNVEARLRRMGPINPLAAREHREVAAEVQTLEEQLADLAGSKQELGKVIVALDDEMASLFMQAFEEIAELYHENFAIVFPGGRGRLRLTDPQNPLHTGVEIEAQPAGKRVGQLSLLSGGERSMAALAFLFAVFRARPSPFYVLDEVEAALDDTNLRRFLRLVATLRNSAQLVIVTHQQQTMEAADLLYGVTMEPGESSVVVAKRFDSAAH